MGDEGFASEQHPVSGRWAVFEDDGQAGYLYLTAPHETRPVADCWLYNRVPAPPMAEAAALAGVGRPPPAAAGYAADHAPPGALDGSAVRFRWSADGEAVAVEAGGQVLGMIVGEGGRWRGVARYVAKPGPWGDPWEEDLCLQLFGS